jgi:hypothetical protein
MTRRFWIGFVLFTAAAAAQITAPRFGFARDRAGALRPVLGVAGSFLLGEPLQEGVISAGFGRKVGFAKTENELLTLRAGEITDRTPAPTGEATFYLGTDGEIAGIYFRSQQELWRVRGSGFEKLANAQEPLPVVDVRGDEISLPSGTILRLPEPVTAIEWLSDSWVIARGSTALHAIRLTGEADVLQLPEAAK